MQSAAVRTARRAFAGLVLAGMMSVGVTVPCLARPKPTNTSKPIKEAMFVPIDGIEQWVTIEGADRANPMILFLHGGPGDALSPFSHALFSSWEDRFTLVQWDQPGAGKTFAKTGDSIASTLTIERVVNDGIAVADYARRRLRKKKLILFGGSWGSVIGVRMAKARPDLFYAYVGTAQIVDMKANLAATYSTVLQDPRNANNAEAVKDLESLGPPPWANPTPAFVRIVRWARLFQAQRSKPLPDLRKILSPDYSDDDMKAWRAADDFSQAHFFGTSGAGEFWNINLEVLGSEFKIPIFISQGSGDLVAVPKLAQDYLTGLRAPDKQFVLIENTDHNALIEAPDVFLQEFLNRVRPLAVSKR